MCDGSRRALHAERLRVRDCREAHQKNWQPNLGRSFHGFAASFETTGATKAPFVFTAGRKTFSVVVEFEWRIGGTLLARNKTPRNSVRSGIHLDCRSTHKPVPAHSEAKRESSTELSTAHVECRVFTVAREIVRPVFAHIYLGGVLQIRRESDPPNWSESRRATNRCLRPLE